MFTLAKSFRELLPSALQNLREIKIRVATFKELSKSLDGAWWKDTLHERGLRCCLREFFHALECFLVDDPGRAAHAMLNDFHKLEGVNSLTIDMYKINIAPASTAIHSMPPPRMR